MLRISFGESTEPLAGVNGLLTLAEVVEEVCDASWRQLIVQMKAMAGFCKWGG